MALKKAKDKTWEVFEDVAVQVPDKGVPSVIWGPRCVISASKDGAIAKATIAASSGRTDPFDMEEVEILCRPFC